MDAATRKIDAALEEALSRGSSQPISAVVRFRSPDQKRRFPTADETGALAEHAISQAQRQSGDRPVDYNVLANLASMVVVASAPFIRGLVECDDVAAATLNHPVELIRPVAKRAAPSGRR